MGVSEYRNGDGIYQDSFFIRGIFLSQIFLPFVVTLKFG